MDLITVDWLLNQGPCERYTNPARLDYIDPAAILGDGLPLEQCLQLDAIPPEDRVWLAVRAMDPVARRRALGRIVRRALGRVPNPDPRSLAVIPYLDAGLAVPGDVAAAAEGAWAEAEEAEEQAAALAVARAAWAAGASAAASAAGAAAAAARPVGVGAGRKELVTQVQDFLWAVG